MGYELTGTPPTDDRQHGVFATHSPYRPRPLRLTVVRLLRRDGHASRVGGEDELRRGWMDNADATPTR